MLIIWTSIGTWSIIIDWLLLDLDAGICMLCVGLTCVRFHKQLLLLLLHDLLFLILKLEHVAALGL